MLEHVVQLETEPVVENVLAGQAEQEASSWAVQGTVNWPAEQDGVVQATHCPFVLM